MKSKSKKQPAEKSTFDNLDKQKGLTLFDHIKHIQKVQDPDYYTSLSETDKKTFNHFMILRGLSMNVELLDDISLLYRYFDIIPSPQFYQLLITVVPKEHPKSFHPWVKASKKNPYSEKLISLVSEKFESSTSESIDYIKIFSQTDSGTLELFNICKGYGLTDKEVEKIMSNE